MKKIITKRKQLQKIIDEIPEENFKVGFVFEMSTISKYKTDKQNKTFHSLLYAFFESGYSSFDNIIDLKNFYKEEMGMDIDYYVYFLRDDVFNSEKNKKFPKPYKTEDVKNLPKDVIAVNKIFKSFSLATEKQVATGIKALIRDIFLSGANADNKIQEILKGMGELTTEDNNLQEQIFNIFPDSKIVSSTINS